MALSSAAALAALRVVSTTAKPSWANFWAMAPPTPQRTPTGRWLSSTALPWASRVLRPSACHFDVAPTTTATGRRVELIRHPPLRHHRSRRRCAVDLGKIRRRAPADSGWQDHSLAGRLRVEQPVGLLRLLERPAVREQLLDVDLHVGDELGALGLPLLRERPRADECHLPAQEIRAHVERHLPALAHEARRAPRAHRAHRRGPRLGRRGAVERLVGSL